MNDAAQLEPLVHESLRRHYGVAPIATQVLSVHSFNTIVQVEARDGHSVLRIGSAQRIHPTGVEEIEAGWLDALAESGLCTLRNLPLLDGSRWAMTAHPDVQGERVVTRFTWVEGAELRSQIDASSAVSAGRLLALLHAQAAEAPPIANVPNSLYARSAVYFGDDNLVATHQTDHGALFTEAIDRVQIYIDELWAASDTPHLIHGDFGPHNILTVHDQLQPIDFQDLRFGFAVQDLGITLSDMDRSTPALVAPFLQGYAAIRSLPDLSPDVLATLAAGRSLNIMNLALLSPASGIGTALDRHVDSVVAWMANQ